MTESRALANLLHALQHPALAAIDLSLGRMQQYLATHGNPERCLPPVIHVAGTNGKGSTIAYLRAILSAAGYRCHVYTSPHLVHFRERIVVAGKQVQDEQLIPLLSDIQRRTQTHPLTFFEATTAAAFELFATHPADFTLLEVGMGGRFDATNCVDKPVLTIITPVSMDHMEFLGSSLAAIAHEKAGIIKHAVPVVIAPQSPDANAAIQKQAKALSAPVLHVDQSLALPLLALAGHHQQINAKTACRAIDALRQQGYSIADDAVSKGLQTANWPARLQKIERGRLRDLLASDQELWLDGGHNIAAAHILADWAAQQSDQPLTIICGMVNRKDPAGFVQVLAPHASCMIAISIPDEPQSLTLEDWQNLTKESNIQIVMKDSIESALALAASKGGRVLICGSLYLAGKILEKNT